MALPNGWLYNSGGTSYYLKSSDIPLLKNNNMYPFIISNACVTSQFSSATSFGNKMVLADGKGAIGFIGCSNDSYWDEDFFWSVGSGIASDNPTYEGTGAGAYDRLFHTHGETPSNWYYTMGQINYSGNMSVSASTATSARKKYYWETYNLVGDPSVIPLLGKPDHFNISLPDTLPNGIKSFSLNTDPFAYVAVSHFDTLWDASFVSPSGAAELNMPGLSDDSCLIVITGQNKYPIIKTIYFSDITKEFINLSGTAINDSAANNNGRADFGETFYLKFTVSNLGLTSANGLYATVTSISDYLTVNNDSVYIGTLEAGSEVSIPDRLSMTISQNAPDLSVATLKLKLKDQLTEKTYTQDITIHSPKLQTINYVIDDTFAGNGDYIADPGESFNLVFKITESG